MENCMYINIMFQEEYKKLDKLCKDCFLSIEGVSEYIRQMKNEQYLLQGLVQSWAYDYKLVQSWEYDYKMLKHVRWIRNQLSHEVGALQSDICTQDDLDFVLDFYNKIVNCLDPLAQMRVLKENERKRQIQSKKQKQSQTQNQNFTVFISESTKQNAPIIKGEKKSSFSKLFEKIKVFFS